MFTSIESDALLALLWQTTWQASVLALVVLAVTSTMRRWIAPKWRSVLWTIPTCRLLLLVIPSSAFSLFNLFAAGVSEAPIVVTVTAPPASSGVLPLIQATPGSPDENTSQRLAARSEADASVELDSRGFLDHSATLPAPNREQVKRFSRSEVLVGVWLTGCLASLLYWMVARIALSRIISRGRVLDDPALVAVIESRRRTLRVRRRIQCIVLDDEIGPATCGIVHPIILLPKGLLRELTVEQLRTILLHEIEHIRRWDGVYSVLSHLATAMHWFNPLAYIMSRKIRHEAELAVDTSTIAGLGEHMRQSYGELLIQLARRPSRFVGLAHMSGGRSNLHTRINDLAAPARTSVLRSTMAITGIVILAMIGLTDAAPTQAQNPEDAKQLAVAQVPGITQSEANNVQTGSTTSPQVAVSTSAPVSNLEEKIARIGETPNWRFVTKRLLETIEQRQSELQGVSVTVLGVVRDEQNEPVDGAFVLLRLFSASSLVRRTDGQVKDVFAVTWTDDQGAFEFQNQPTPWFEPARPVDWELCVFAPGQAIATKRYQYLDGEIRNEIIALQPERVIEATIKDPDGRPISDFAVAHVEIVNPYDHASLECSLLYSELQFFIRSDKQGKIRIGGLPPQRIATIIPRHPREFVGKSATHIATSADPEPEKMIDKGTPRSGLVYPYLNPVCEIIAERTVNNPAENVESQKSSVKQLPTRTVTVRVINADNGENVSGVTVGWDNNVKKVRTSPGMHVTNKEGIVMLEIPQRAVDVFVGGRRFGFVTPYERITTSSEEYTPTVQRDDWVRRMSQGEQDLSVTFELQPVPPLQITVQKEDGTPVIAELRVAPHGWEQSYQMPAIHSDAQGQASIALRPVWFHVDLTATTEDGLKGSLTIELSNDVTKSEKVNVVVKK